MVLAFCFVLAGQLVSAPGASEADGTRYARLGAGSIGHFSWFSWIESSKSTGIGLPCLLIETEEPSRSSSTAVANETYGCGRATDDAPLVEEISNDAAGKRRRTVLLMAFGENARRLEIDFADRGVQTFNLKRLSDQRSSEIGVRPIAYWARAFGGPLCVRHITTYDGSGSKLSDGGATRCVR